MVSKVLPEVSMVTVPLEGAVQVHHAECPPVLLVMKGSPASRVSEALEAVAEAVLPERVKALAKLSLLSVLVTVSVAATVLLREPAGSWAMAYSVYEPRPMPAVEKER